MDNIFKQMAERARAASRAIKKPRPEDDGPVLEMTIPMPEVGVAVQAHWMERRDEREAEEKRFRHAELKRREDAARRSGEWTETSPSRTKQAEQMREIGREFTLSGLRPVGPSEQEEEKQRQRDRGMSM
ncbi:hypothetical protein WMC41_13500 [Shinella yambaruensis]|uniref:hypothetical protein n=1 Tax=Shinella yambaruensis TaxID=415996 RepID=UPI003D79A7FC